MSYCNLLHITHSILVKAISIFVFNASDSIFERKTKNPFLAITIFQEFQFKIFSNCQNIKGKKISNSLSKSRFSGHDDVQILSDIGFGGILGECNFLLILSLFVLQITILFWNQ
jgi:hypothetical protein